MLHEETIPYEQKPLSLTFKSGRLREIHSVRPHPHEGQNTRDFFRNTHDFLEIHTIF